MLSVIALGAVCELEDVTAPPRVPILDGRDDISLSDERSEEADKVDEKSNRRQSSGFIGQVAPRSIREPQVQEAHEIELSFFYVEEFADLSDGRRVVLRDDRGWYSWPVNSSNRGYKHASGRELTKYAISCLDPDDDEEWIDWIVNRLLSLGIVVDPTTVHSAHFFIEFGPLVQRELRERKSRQ